METPLF